MSDVVIRVYADGHVENVTDWHGGAVDIQETKCASCGHATGTRYFEATLASDANTEADSGPGKNRGTIVLIERRAFLGGRT